jgi:hypothetical protein
VSLDFFAKVEVLDALDVFDLLQAGNAQLDGGCAVEEGEEVVVLRIDIE